MARPSAEYNTKTKTSRLRLAPRVKPYFRSIGAGKSLGYVRRDGGAGSWVVREWSAGRYAVRTLGAADDVGRADGRDVLTFEQALRASTSPVLPQPAGARLTVRTAIENYLTALAARSNHANEARQRAEKHILPKLGDIRVDRLTKQQIENWRAALVKDEDATDSGARRRSQDSANRILTILKAALNAAFADESNNIPTDAAWRRVKAYRDVGAAREDHFDAGAVVRLVAEAMTFDKAFANLLEAGYLTGARYGELAALDVRDFDHAKAVLMIRKGKTGSRPVSLSAEGAAFFTELTRNRPAAAVLLPRADGGRWGKSEQARPFKRAAAAADLPASASFYTLRHSHISRAIEAGMPLSLLAENCGTSLAMIQKNYAHVLAATRREVMQATAPKLRLVK
jgi:integrase